ncbi:terminase gpA endonuclease subunit [Aureliella helgolandensis]|uniref:Phage terminase large subunit (GpA) n=1 Tax=Aureliella helgolandensis TaxID=2527968 RepID=A0A518GBI7_9BACT|nr:terminase gpA endonuclease subunit [Aureliella helgolandensis]QDV25949.1 Phage terminase large subunit (GpA) [Aureliella helgolandensis]
MLLTEQAALQDMKWFLEQAKPRRMRSMRQFAEEEIVLPSGPYAGTRFRVHRQPYTGLWFDQVDSGRWSRFVATGPTQSGKSISCFVIPLLYHLFEYGETVICGVPDMDMAADKWREDLLPIIERSRYRDQLPKQGSGSRGGLVQSLQFRNGATLRFMSGGGGDKSRAAFTSRVVVITETDGMDESGRKSREADKISQLIARTRAFGHRARVYMECTVSTEQGRTWQEYTRGTQSQIVLPCPLCGAWVSPEREQLIGWQEAESQLEARKTAAFSCSACQEPWSEPQRVEANRNCRLVHHGQTINSSGEIEGEYPETETLGFRWSAVNNLFATTGEIASEEWVASRAADEDNAERERRQFVWCLPVVPTKWTDAEIETHELACRVAEVPRGVVPMNADTLTIAMDLGKYLNHWVVVAWSAGPYGHVVDYGRIEVASDDLGVEQATMVALRQFRAMVLAGWPIGVVGGETLIPQLCFIDAGYMTDVVYAFNRESGNRFIPSVGRGASQQHQQWQNRETQTGSVVQHLGEGFHINWLPNANVYLAEVDADHWKTWVHQRLSTPTSRVGAITLFQANATEHLSFAKHLTAEVKTEEFISGKGMVAKWDRKRKQNHWFDALYNACAAGHYCGVRLVEEERRQVPPKPKPAPDPQRKPYIDVERWRANQRRFWGR